MLTQRETLEIACPLCAKIHRYSMKIEKTIVVGFGSRERQWTFTRLFTCPVKNEDFQALIRIQQGSNERIDNIEIEKKISL